MRIERRRRAQKGGRVEAAATIMWEDSDRAPVDLRHAAEGEAARGLLRRADPRLFGEKLPRARRAVSRRAHA